MDWAVLTDSPCGRLNSGVVVFTFRNLGCAPLKEVGMKLFAAKYFSLLVPCLLLAVSAARAGEPAPAEACVADGAYSIVRHLESLEGSSFWPGFQPEKIPLAIYDGERTCLYGHPNPPEGFAGIEDHPDTFVFAGRHASISANTSVDLNGTLTATLMVERYDGRTQDEWAAIAAHEKFHVFQGERHPDWSANEANLFVYPVEDADLLALRVLETEALRRALDGDEETGASWALAALQLRQERFAQMEEDFPAYERGTEMKEGLAQYIQFRANPDTGTGRITAEPFAADAVRLRAYATGLAIARLLDQFHPEWKDALEADDTQSLESLLSAALEQRTIPTVQFSEGERSTAREKGDSLVNDLLRKRSEKRKQFDDQPGWTLILEVRDSNRLWPQGFDPVNVLRLSEAEILHSRFLRLGNGSGKLEIMNHISLSEGFGPHPLFNGTRKLTVKGLLSKPEVRTDEGKISITGEGIQLDFQDATVQISERTIHMVLANPTEENSGNP